MSADGNQVYATGLERFGNVFVPVKATAKAELSEAKSLTSKDKFRLTFDMFSGWEQNGKENTFSVKDADGNEIVGFTITGGGYNLNQLMSKTVNCVVQTVGRPHHRSMQIIWDLIKR